MNHYIGDRLFKLDSDFNFKLNKDLTVTCLGDGTYPCKACLSRKAKCMYKMKAPKRSSVSSKLTSDRIHDSFLIKCNQLKT